MKKITLQLLLTILPAFIGFAQGSQDFETQTALTTQYANGSFTENGVIYTYVHCRNEGLGTNDDYSIGGTKGIMLRRINENSHIEWTIPNGIGTLSFDARKAFIGGNNNRQLEVLVNGISTWTSPTFGTAGEDTTVHPFTVPINEQGSVTVRIKIGGTTSGNRQVTLDNISWTIPTSATYCTPKFTNEWSDHISNVSTSGALINLNNSSVLSSNGYGDYSDTHSVTAIAGTTFNLTVTYQTCWMRISVWVDTNNNGFFEDSERVIALDAAFSSQSGLITVPATAGSYRMRVMSMCYTGSLLNNPCITNGWSGEAEDYTLIVVTQNPCSGTPSAGSITVNPSKENAGNTYTVSATGQSLIDWDYTYQWQSNTNGAGWVNEGSAMTTYADLVQTANPVLGTIVEYRLVITCTNSGFSDTSNVVSFLTHKKYCFPQSSTNPNAGGINNINKWINNFTTSGGIVDISNLSTGRSPNGYADYSATHQAMFNVGDNVNFNVALTHFTSSSPWTIGIWIDWNNDGNLDFSERIYISPTLIPYNTLTTSGSFEIPPGTPEGIYRMRVVMKQDNSFVDDPCFISFGDVEDYSLVVVSSTCLPPIELNSTPNSLTNTTLSWTAVGNETNFEVQWGDEYFALGTGAILNGITINSIDVNTITDKKYEFYVRTDCGSGNYSAWVGPFKFYTGYCIPDYIPLAYSITNFEITNAVTNLVNDSGVSDFYDPASVYSNFSNLYAEAYEDTTLSYNLKSNLSGTVRIIIWADWNKNGVFETDEILSNVVSSTTHFQFYPGYNGTLTLPSSITPGDYRLRVKMVWYANNQPVNVDPCMAYSNAQTQDYTLRIVPIPCIVNIPDANFKAYLVGNTAINTNGDTEIQCSEAAAFTGMINCSNQNIANLTGIEAFVNITELRCHQNQLTSLDVSSNVNLTILRCYTNQLTTLDVSNNVNLTRLYCHDNQLTTLDVSSNDLEYLWCYDNQLTSLNVSNNATMERLLCYNNQLTTLDVSDPTGLLRLETANNELTSLNISSNTSLNRLECNNNQLTSLNLKNGNNLNFVTLDAKNNPNLACIEVDDVAYSNISWADKKDATAVFSENCGYTQPCVVNIPDTNFKNALLTHTPTIDTNGDGEIQCDEADAFTGLLNVSAKGIADLTGIEAFVNITQLNCSLNKLTSLNVSNNTALTVLNCNGFGLPNFNQITALDVSNNTALTELQCEGNLLSSLNVSNNTALTKLICGGNQLTSLDVASNTALTELRCLGNLLTTLNVSNNTALLQLWCGENQLTALDVSNNTALVWLICPDNQLTSLDTSNNAVLEYLICNENQITSLDVSGNTALKGVECNDNQLTSLNVKNGNSSSFLFFGATDNPNLRCIEVDNVAYSNVAWANFKDVTACFSDVACITPTFDLPTSVCQNATAPVLPALSGNIVSGSWSPATIDTSSINTQTYIFTPTLCANPYQITISVVATPDAPTGEPSQTFNSGQTIADLVVSGSNLVWSSSSTFSDTLSDSEPLVNGTTYYVRNEDGNCQSSALAITVNLDCLSVVSTPTGEATQTFNAGQTIADLTVNGTNLVWYADSSLTTILPTTTELVNNTIYYVVEENLDCQSSLLEILAIETVSVTNFNSYGFSYYPNPVNDMLHFSSNQPIENVLVTNMLGQQINVSTSSDNKNLDMSNLPSGNYLVKVTIDGVAKMIKVVKR